MDFFKLEESLPRLPVPSLAASAQQILTALKPMLTVEEYDEVLHEALQFVANDTVNAIQRHLEAASRGGVGCYLNAINGASYAGVYGDVRGDTLPRNPYLVLEEDPYAQTISPPNQAQRAALLVNSLLKFVVLMRSGTLQHDVTPKLRTPLTMNCYRNLFGATRVPDGDAHQVTVRKYAHVDELRHVVFLCNNQYYTLEVLTPTGAESDGKHRIWFSDADLAREIQAVIDSAQQIDRVSSVSNGIGSITTQTFSQWRAARSELERLSPELLAAIDNALFVVVLDTTAAPVLDQEKTVAISHGTNILKDGTNIQVGSCTLRWYDKLQLVVTANAVAGVVWESLYMDSTAILRFVLDVYTDTILKLARNINGAENTLFDASVRFVLGQEQDRPAPRVVEFAKTPELTNLVHLSETRLADLLNQHEYKTLTMKFDSHLLHKFDLSPDSFLQVGFQIANYALYGRVANTLEPITTRKFRDARTDLIAVQNDLVASLSKLFITSSDDARKWRAFKACCEMHTQQYRDAMQGHGFERHVLGLLQVLQTPHGSANLNAVNRNADVAPLPPWEQLATAGVPLLSNPLLEKLTQAELLISNCGNPALRLFGIPPAVDQGFGIAYIIHKDKVVVTVSSKYRQTQRFLDTFRLVMTEVKGILRSEADVLMTVTDSESRKIELKRLRIERELKNVNRTLSLTRHPIEISVAALLVDLVREAKEPSDARTPDKTENKSDDDFGDYLYLGGYGYFDVGEVAVRSDEISRSTLHLNSRLALRASSRYQSSANLHAMGKVDVRERLSERIRDQLSPSLNSLSVSLASGHEEKPKSRIGREVTIT